MPSSCWNLSEFCILSDYWSLVWKRERLAECAVRGRKKEKERDEAVLQALDRACFVTLPLREPVRSL